jgi:hypothetical protein
LKIGETINACLEEVTGKIRADALLIIPVARLIEFGSYLAIKNGIGEAQITELARNSYKEALAASKDATKGIDN